MGALGIGVLGESTVKTRLKLQADDWWVCEYVETELFCRAGKKYEKM